MKTFVRLLLDCLADYRARQRLARLKYEIEVARDAARYHGDLADRKQVEYDRLTRRRFVQQITNADIRSLDWKSL